MGILNRDEIRRRITSSVLITNARRNEQGQFDVEAASYDLTAGTAIWKESTNSDEKGSIQTRHFNPSLQYKEQPAITLQPGQMMFVITHEELSLPNDLCATVYSRNKLAREGILALNAGHVDPGYHGPIAIRLINLRSIPYVLRLGDPIYTVVFHQLYHKDGDTLVQHATISMNETIDKYTKAATEALSNALHDLSLTQDFLRKEEFGDAFWKWLKANTLKVIVLIAAVIGFIVGVVATIPTIIEIWKKLMS